jgi:hypothetical protein
MSSEPERMYREQNRLSSKPERLYCTERGIG